MSHCGSLVNFGSCGSDLDNAYSKLMRIGRLREAIDEYASNVEKLDVGLSGDYANWKKTQLSPITMVASPNKMLNAALSQTFSIKQLEEAKSSLETILAKDYSEWTEDDAKAVALVYKNAVDEGDEDTLEKIYKGCLTGNCNVVNAYGRYAYYYCVKSDNDKVTAILSEMDESQDIYAYNTLLGFKDYEISGTFFELKSHEYTLEDVIEEINVNSEFGDCGIKSVSLSYRNNSSTIKSIDDNKVRKIMAKKVDEWSDTDALYAASAWVYYFEDNDKQNISTMATALFNNEHDVSVINAVSDNGYNILSQFKSVSVDQGKINKMLGSVNKITQSKAYTSLYNLSQVEDINYLDSLDGNEFFFYVSADNINDKTPYLTLNKVYIKNTIKNKTIGKVYAQNLEDNFSPKVLDSLELLGLSTEELASMLDEYNLNLSYDEYSVLTESEKREYEGKAMSYAARIVTAQALSSQTFANDGVEIPIGFDMTIKYSTSVKAMTDSDEVQKTLEFQKGKLASITATVNNTNVSLYEDTVRLDQRTDILNGDAQVGKVFEVGYNQVTIGYNYTEGNTTFEMKILQGYDGTISIVYSGESVFDNKGSVYSEMCIKKYNSGNKSYELNNASSILEIMLDAENIPDTLKTILRAMPVILPVIEESLYVVG
jgi:hypothetical protein